MQCFFFFLFSLFWKKKKPSASRSIHPLLDLWCKEQTCVCVKIIIKKKNKVQGWCSWGPSSIHSLWQQSLITINDDSQLVKDATIFSLGVDQKGNQMSFSQFVFPSGTLRGWFGVLRPSMSIDDGSSQPSIATSLTGERVFFFFCLLFLMDSGFQSVISSHSYCRSPANGNRSIRGGNWGGWRTERES